MYCRLINARKYHQRARWGIGTVNLILCLRHSRDGFVNTKVERPIKSTTLPNNKIAAVILYIICKLDWLKTILVPLRRRRCHHPSMLTRLHKWVFWQSLWVCCDPRDSILSCRLKNHIKHSGAWEEFASYACMRLIGENKQKRDTKKLVLSFQGSVKTKQCHSHNKKC